MAPRPTACEHHQQHLQRGFRSCKVKKAEATFVGIHMGTLPAADMQWPVAGVCNEPIPAQIWAWHRVSVHLCTPTHTWAQM